MNRNFQARHSLIMMLMLLIATICTTACSDDDDVKSQGFDPTKPVSITQFIPESGGVGQQLVIYGSNFGDNKDNVTVTIGGKKAVVVNVKNEAIYCYVPSGAFTGEIEITITDGTSTKTAQATTAFDYQRNMVVGTLCGWQNERDDQGWVDGSFATCAGFRNDGVMQFSPYNHNQLFILYDQEPNLGTVAHGIQLLDLKEQTVQTILPLSMFNNERLRTIDFAVDPYAYDEYGNILYDDETGEPIYGDSIDATTGRKWVDDATDNQKKWREHLIVSQDKDDSNMQAISVWIVDRDPNGEFSSNSPHRALATYRQCNGASLHPNGELYFTSYTEGRLLRLDMNKYWATLSTGETWDPVAKNNWEGTGNGAFKNLFRIQDNGWEFQIDIHPSGDYAYIVVINKHYILRTDYNWETHEFSSPYIICGSLGTEGFTDGVGQSALLHRPYQGTFVKNDKYVAEGRDDIYDFYFCDSQNDAIRYLTPEGIVTTYAGGGGKQGGASGTYADGLSHGSENGELLDVARFYRCTGLVNDVHKDKITGENTLIFYILDTKNARIRTITMEEGDEATVQTDAIDTNKAETDSGE